MYSTPFLYLQEGAAPSPPTLPTNNLPLPRLLFLHLSSLSRARRCTSPLYIHPKARARAELTHTHKHTETSRMSFLPAASFSACVGAACTSVLRSSNDRAVVYRPIFLRSAAVFAGPVWGTAVISKINKLINNICSSMIKIYFFKLILQVQ
jgi:hypothetical protein